MEEAQHRLAQHQPAIYRYAFRAWWTSSGPTTWEASAEGADLEQVKRLGESPVILRFRLDNGAVLQMAASGEALELAQGPFSTSEAPGEDRG